MKGAKGESNQKGIPMTFEVVDELDLKINPMTQADYDTAVMLFGKETADRQWEIANGKKRVSA